jgi:hypothetical protein
VIGRPKKKILHGLTLLRGRKRHYTTEKSCSGQTCADRSETGSTGFGQDGPGKILLKTAELKFSWPSHLSFK